MIFAIVSAFCLVHLQIHRIKAFDVIPRSRVLSFSGGVSTAYIFLYLIPQISAKSAQIVSHAEWIPGNNQEGAFFIALAGLCVFYGLERRTKLEAYHKSGVNKSNLYLLKLFSFTSYNFIISALLPQQERAGVKALLFFSVAMIVNFLVADYGFLQEHKTEYLKSGRWFLVASAIGGALSTAFFNIPSYILLAFMALLAGGVILNVFKEELPRERESRFSAFLVGVVFYSFLLFSF